MTFLVKGLSYGLLLSVLTGPLFFALIQAGMERGIKLGAVLGSGIWLSDLLYITMVYLGVSTIAEVVETPNFKFLLGTIGGVLLIGIGLYTLLTKPVIEPQQDITSSTYSGYFFKGFFINTFNPFTVFFWLTITGAEVVGSNASDEEAVYFFGGIFIIIILTDLLKVVLAKHLRQYLRLRYILIFRRTVGVIMMVAGATLIFRSVF